MTKMSAFAVVLVAAASVSTAAEPIDPWGYTVLIQQSPAGAGTITPGDGAHTFDIGQTVTLSAMPRQGYRFLYWLGDVSATSNTTTSISVDSPKLVIAVFERSDFEDDEEVAGGFGSGQAAGGGGGLRPSPNPLTAPGSVSPASYNGRQPLDITGGSGNGSDPDNPIPEPATMALLGLGAAMLFGRRRYGR